MLWAATARSKKLAAISPRYMVPTYATVVRGNRYNVFYVAVKLVSKHALWDTIAALGIMICWYCSIRAFAQYCGSSAASCSTSCTTSSTSWCSPLLGGIMLATVFVISVQRASIPASGTSALFGMGLVWIMGIGLLVLGCHGHVDLTDKGGLPSSGRTSAATLSPMT